jgi:histone-lysine N-methyltransferase SUV420H
VGAVLQELQGSVVPLPEEWRAEMDLGDEYELAREAAGEESEQSEDESEAEEEGEQSGRRKGKEVDRGQRRSDRTRRRDFSIVWSGLKRCYQLFLGPARFLNVSTRHGGGS